MHQEITQISLVISSVAVHTKKAWVLSYPLSAQRRLCTTHTHFVGFVKCRVQSGIFGQTAKFGQPPCLFHSSIIGIKIKLTKQTVKIKLFANVCPNLPDVRVYLTLPFLIHRCDLSLIISVHLSRSSTGCYSGFLPKTT